MTVKAEVDVDKVQAQLVEAFAPVRSAMLLMAEACAELANDLVKIAAQVPGGHERCAPDGSYHVTPHRGCILR